MRLGCNRGDCSERSWEECRSQDWPGRSCCGGSGGGDPGRRGGSGTVQLALPPQRSGAEERAKDDNLRTAECRIFALGRSPQGGFPRDERSDACNITCKVFYSASYDEGRICICEGRFVIARPLAGRCCSTWGCWAVSQAANRWENLFRGGGGATLEEIAQ